MDDDAALTALLFPGDSKAAAERPEPDWARIHAELEKKEVTKQLLWQEYLETHPGGYQYSRFCERYGFETTGERTLRRGKPPGPEFGPAHDRPVSPGRAVRHPAARRRANRHPRG